MVLLALILELMLLLRIVDMTTLNGTLSILMIAEPRFGSIVNVKLLNSNWDQCVFESIFALMWWNGTVNLTERDLPTVGFAVVVHANGIWIRPRFPVTNAFQFDHICPVLIAIGEQSEPVQAFVRGQTMVTSRRTELRVTVAHSSTTRYVVADGRPEMRMRKTVHYGIVHHGCLWNIVELYFIIILSLYFIIIIIIIYYHSLLAKSI